MSLHAKRHHSCILATCCVPWNARLEFAEETFRRSVRHLVAHGIGDLYIFGTAGEGYAVTESQFDAVTHVFLDEARANGARPMIGIISLSLPTVIERIERAREMGARCFQISLPSWGALRDSEMATFFRETCGRFPDSEFLHYNLQRTGRLITGAEYGRLAVEHPNLVATKNSTADEARLRSLLTDAPQLQHFITEAGFAKAALMGECGFLVSIASTNLAMAHRYFRAGVERDSRTLSTMAQELAAMIEILREAVGPEPHIDGAFDKIFCRMQDAQFPLRLLPPYAAASEAAFERFTATLRKRHSQWLPETTSP